MPKAKKFIDRKNSVTFHLVHRSQQDPLAADETAPQRVLVPVESQSGKVEKKKFSEAERIKRKEEQQKFGIFFDDDYDYLQHLKDVNSLPIEWVQTEQPDKKKDNDKNNEPKINLPSSVFASEVEEKVGLLNKAAPISGPRLDLDPDIVAAMDEDFDYDDPDNQLDDDFMQLANAAQSDDEFNEEDEYGSDVSSGDMADEERDDVASLNGPQYSFRDEETKSRFTEYSMSSSVLRRNEHLTLLDDKFERMFAEYDEEEIGPLDTEEIDGYMDADSEIMMKYVEEYEKLKNEANENMAQLMKNRLKIIEQGDLDSDEGLEKHEVQEEKDHWDCESILTTYSNIYNHPKLISEPKKLNKIKIDNRTGIPKGILDNKPGQLTIKNLAQLDAENKVNKLNDIQSVAETLKSTLSILSERPKTETPEERRERKKALKEYRKERREERKANKDAFKEEKKLQEKIMINKQRNIQGKRIL